jgi:hypothetical protein
MIYCFMVKKTVCLVSSLFDIPFEVFFPQLLPFNSISVISIDMMRKCLTSWVGDSFNENLMPA